MVIDAERRRRISVIDAEGRQGRRMTSDMRRRQLLPQVLEKGVLRESLIRETVPMFVRHFCC